MKHRSEGRFKNLSPGAYKSWDIVSVGIRCRKGEREMAEDRRDETRRDETVLSRNFTRQTVLLFPRINARPGYGAAAVCFRGRVEVK